MFSQLIAAIDCEVLLDLAHAQISAFNMHWPSIYDYLHALPLGKVREIHINHPRHEETQMLDGHLPLQADDLELLFWALAHTPAKSVTLESDTPDVPTLKQEIELLRTVRTDSVHI